MDVHFQRIYISKHVTFNEQSFPFMYYYVSNLTTIGTSLWLSTLSDPPIMCPMNTMDIVFPMT